MASTANRERGIAIVGVAESDIMGTVPDKSSLQHHAEAAHNALEDAGLSMSDINGLMTARIQHVGNGGVLRTAAIVHRQHLGGRVLLRDPRCPRRRGDPRRLLRYGPHHPRPGWALDPSPGPSRSDPRWPQYETPYGMIGQPINYAMACTRYMHEYGEERTRQALAEIAVSTRAWANLNPVAYMHETPMSFDDYHNSPLGGLALPPVRLLPGNRLRGCYYRYDR